MSLTRNSQSDEEQPQSSQNNSPTTTELQQSLRSLWAQIENYRAETQEQAADKYEMTLLLATVHELCEIQEGFMENVKSEMAKTLSVQNEYKESVRGEVNKILNHIYKQIEERQETAFNKMLEQNEKALQDFEKETNECFINCSFAVDTVKKKITEMQTIDSFTDFLLILAPLSVIGSFVMKIIELFS